jgi:secreted trypsin-like serine protease
VGHCNPPLAQPVKVKVGRYSFSKDNSDEVFSIQKTQRHPGYGEVAWFADINDFNIFKLHGFSKQPVVKINRDPNVPQPGELLTVVGAGSTSPNPDTFLETAADTIQEAQLRVVSKKQCEKASDPSRNLTNAYAGKIFDSMLCTRGDDVQSDACAFDSGAPFIVSDDDGVDTVVAMVSSGIGCADPIFPAIQSRISYAADWIDQTVCDLSDADRTDLADFHCENHPPAIFRIRSIGGELFWDGNGWWRSALQTLFFGLLVVGTVVAVLRKIQEESRDALMMATASSFRRSSEREPLQSANLGIQTYEAM